MCQESSSCNLMDPAVISILEYVKCWKYIIVLILQIRLLFFSQIWQEYVSELNFAWSCCCIHYHLKLFENISWFVLRNIFLCTVRNLVDFSWHLDLQSIQGFNQANIDELFHSHFTGTLQILQYIHGDLISFPKKEFGFIEIKRKKQSRDVVNNFFI